MATRVRVRTGGCKGRATRILVYTSHACKFNAYLFWPCAIIVWPISRLLQSLEVLHVQKSDVGVAPTSVRSSNVAMNVICAHSPAYMHVCMLLHLLGLARDKIAARVSNISPRTPSCSWKMALDSGKIRLRAGQVMVPEALDLFD